MAAYGDVQKLELVRDSVTLASKCFAFVDFVSPPDASKCLRGIEDAGGLWIDGQKVEISFAHDTRAMAPKSKAKGFDMRWPPFTSSGSDVYRSMRLHHCLQPRQANACAIWGGAARACLPLLLKPWLLHLGAWQQRPLPLNSSSSRSSNNNSPPKANQGRPTFWMHLRGYIMTGARATSTTPAPVSTCASDVVRCAKVVLLTGPCVCV